MKWVTIWDCSMTEQTHRLRRCGIMAMAIGTAMTASRHSLLLAMYDLLWLIPAQVQHVFHSTLAQM